MEEQVCTGARARVKRRVACAVEDAPFRVRGGRTTAQRRSPIVLAALLQLDLDRILQLLRRRGGHRPLVCVLCPTGASLLA